MATNEHTTSRRGVIAALAGTPFLTGTMAAAIAVPASAASGAAWAQALADYRKRRAHSDTMPDDGDVNGDSDKAIDAYCESMDYLIGDVPAPDLPAVITKFELALERWDGFDFPDWVGEAILADLRRFAGEA